MFKRKRQTPPPEALPTEFSVAVKLWQKADNDVHVALGRFRTAPNQVNRLGVMMAWAALKVPLEALSSWARAHPQAIGAVAWAWARSEALHTEIVEASLIEEQPIILD